MTTPGSNGHAAASDSPSLIARRDPAHQAFEMKFLLDEAQAAEVLAWARQRLAPDPHGEASLDGAYRTTSLYLDTPAMDVCHRTPGYASRKYRIRRYGALPWAYLERKARRGDRVAKRRAPVVLEELHRLGLPLATDRMAAPPVVNGVAVNGYAAGEWPGAWFHRQITVRGLRPACCIAYERTAFFASTTDGPVRLTFDRAVRGVLCALWELGVCEPGRPLLVGQVILEMKFLDAMPRLFREALATFRLSPSPVSKYRLCRDAWGAVSSAAEVSRA